MSAAGIQERWVAFVVAADKPGTMTALSSVFSTRGVSFDSFDTLDVRGGVGVMAVIFRASDRLARVLVRTLERIAVARSVTLLRAEDPQVRAIAVIDHAPDAEAGPGRSDGRAVPVTWIEGSSASSTVCTGTLAEVEARAAAARAAGAAIVSLTVLPPR